MDTAEKKNLEEPVSPPSTGFSTHGDWSRVEPDTRLEAPGDRDFLSAGEVRSAIESLTTEEMLRLKRVARILSIKTKGMMDADDIITEAFVRALRGDRKWNRGYDAVTFFAGQSGVMRSIAYAASKKRNAVDMSENVSDHEESLADATAESELTTGIIIDSFMKVLDGDPIAQTMLSDMLAGYHGEELRRRIGLDRVAFDSKLRKIRRRFERAHLEGII